MFKSKEEKTNWERLKMKERKYDLLVKEIKKSLIDMDDDYIDVLDDVIPTATRDQIAEIMILMEIYEENMYNTRLMTKDLLSNYNNENEE